MGVISAHEHLAEEHEDIAFLVESGVFEQIWLQCLHPDQDYLEEHLKVKEEFGDFFEIFGKLDWDADPQHIDRLKDRGIFGLKAIRPPLPYDHESYFAFYERAAELQMPILFHTGVIGPSVRRKERGASIPPPDKNAESKDWVRSGGRASHMRPSMLQPIASTFPHLTLINGHPGFPWLEEGWENLYYYDNIYLDISSGHSLPCLDQWAFRFFGSTCANPALRFTDKLLFAIDGKVGAGRGMHEWLIRCARFWQEFFELVGSGHDWGKEADKVFRENARLILREYGRLNNA